MYLGLADEAGVFLRKRIIDLDADGEDRVLITGPEFVFVATVRFRDRWVNSATFRAGMPDVPDPHVFITKRGVNPFTSHFRCLGRREKT